MTTNTPGAKPGKPVVLNWPRPLSEETRSGLPTEEAAHHLVRKPQTLRRWAAYENGPIQPIRVHGRLLWPVRRIRELVEEGVQ